MAHRCKAPKAMGIALAAVAVVATGAILVHRDDSLHAGERLVAKAYDAGF